jgi:hypothetical protein
MAEANNKQICQRHSSSALFLPLQWSWRSHSSGFGLRSKFVTSGLCLKSSLLPASVCLFTQTGLRLGFNGGSKTLADWPKATVHWRYSYHLQCSLLMQLEKSQLLIQTLFQICRKQCVLALANKKKTNKHKKREKSSKKRKQKCEKYATVIVGARNDSQKRAKTTRTTLHCRQTDCGRLCLWICTMRQMRSS